MHIRWVIFIACVGNLVFGNRFQDCFRKDSISCLQIQLFKITKEFIDKPSIELFNGIGLIKTESKEVKSLEQKENEKGVLSAVDVESRQKALESYLIAIGERLWKERTVTWNPVQTAKAAVNNIPDTMTNEVTSMMSQGRGKKKQMQALLPLLMAFKLKFATLSSIAYAVIAVIAKKAILAAVIALVLSGFSGIKSLTSPKPQLHAAEVMGYQASNDWDPYTQGGGRLAYGNLMTGQSEPAPQKQILIGHKGG